MNGTFQILQQHCLTDALFNSAGKIKINKDHIYTGKSMNNLTGCTRGQNWLLRHIHLVNSRSSSWNISGLAHLEGQTVSILADGATHPTKVVSSGAISLNRAAKKVK